MPARHFHSYLRPACESQGLMENPARTDLAAANEDSAATDSASSLLMKVKTVLARACSAAMDYAARAPACDPARKARPARITQVARVDSPVFAAAVALPISSLLPATKRCPAAPDYAASQPSANRPPNPAIETMSTPAASSPPAGSLPCGSAERPQTPARAAWSRLSVVTGTGVMVAAVVRPPAAANPVRTPSTVRAASRACSRILLAETSPVLATTAR
jgi:hypothetical protein